MILGVGLDVVDTRRVASALKTYGSRFEERLWTQAELTDCAARADRARALASRFAAKEAFLKALGTGSARGLAFRQVEVVRGENGRPALRLTDAAAVHARERGVRHVHVSLSHEPNVAAAVVVLEG